MSKEIEQRVLEMQFDNKQFERGVSTTMSSLDKLKQSLNLSGAAKGLESVGTAARGINLSGLTGAAETVSLKFNAMYSAIDQIFRNLVTRAQYTGERMISALTIDPIKTGFSEYETQINSVQTILANTKSKGTTIDDVNGALDELNTYADKTIYNFTEMTRNIGTFTAAGVDLDKSVTSIKGIANLAAVSGSSSQQASTAMYQLSQALAAGKVQLMDWNSVVNAGMGGEVFQNALKRTAKNMGTDVDALIKKYGSFRESLTQGEWLTADVLTETLTQLSGAYTEADLLAKGYTKEQAAEILDLANTAEEAATKVKTFTQLWDTLKEAAQSGWTQSWEILIGDFEEAKEMLSKVSDVIGKMIGDSAEARNNLLQGWKDAGGRDDLLQGFVNIFDALMRVIRPISAAFKEIFPPVTVDQLVKFTEGFKNFTENLKLSSPNIAKLKTTFKGIFSVLDIGWTVIKDLAGGVVKLLGHFTGLGGSILDITSKIGEWLLGLRDTVKETDYFGIAVDKIVGFLGGAIDKLKSFGSAIKSAFQSKGITVFYDILSSIWSFIIKIGSRIGEIFAPLGEAVGNLFKNGNFSDILNDGIFAAILVGIYNFVGNLNGPLESLKDLFEGISGEDGILGGLKETLDSVRGCFEAYQNSLKADILKKIAVAIAILAGSLFVISSIDGEALDRSLGAIAVLFADLIASLAIFTKLNFGGKGLVKGVAAITGLAGALLILSGAMKIMSTMSWEEVGIALTGTAIGLTILVAAVNALPESKVNKAAKAVRTLSVALLILAAGMKIMASMSMEEMGVALIGVAGGLVALVTAVNLLPKDTGLRSLGMVGLATSLVILGGAMKIMASMSWDEIAKGLAAMSGALLAIGIAMNLLPKDAALNSIGMIAIAGAIVILGTALKSMGGMTWDEIAKGLAAMGGALLEIGVALNLMNGTLAGSAALILAAGALAIMAPVLKSLGDMSWLEIGKGLVALAGAFAVVGVAGLLLTPLVPTLLSLAAAMALFGVATIGIGVGIAAIAYGLTALVAAFAVGAPAIAAALSATVSAALSFIPMIIEGLGDAILALCDVLIECAPRIAETILVVLTEVMAAIATYTPQIVDFLMKFLIGVLDALAANLPQLIVSAVNLIGAFFRGIVDALKGIDTTALLEGIAGAGLLAGLIFALSALTPMIPGAMVGILGMGAVVAEMALVLAAIGLLAQIPGLSWLIEEGGDFLQKIGTAIGQFIGGIVGGIAEGATSTLPQVGTNLSDFMTNLQPFLDGAKKIDATMMEGVRSLAETILLLTGANLLDGLARFITGEGSLTKFGSELGTLGTNLNTFATNLGTFDDSKVATITCAANAIKTLADVASSIPNEGGWAAAILGDNSLATFGGHLPGLATNLAAFATNLGTFDDAKVATVTCAANSIKALADVANNLPNQGGWAAAILGDNSLATFGSQLPDLGTNLSAFATNLGTFDGAKAATVTCAANAIKALADVAKGIEGQAEWAKALFGDNGLAAFSSEFGTLGTNLSTFVTNLGTFTDAQVTAVKSAVSAIKAFASLAGTDLSAASTNLGGFGDNMAALGSDIATFTSTLPPYQSIASAISGLNLIISVIDDIADANSGALSTFAENLKKIGGDAVDKFVSAFTSEGAASRAKAGARTLANEAVAAIPDKYQSFYDAGSHLVNGFSAGISENSYKAEAKARAMAAAAAEAAEDELDINSPSRVGYGIGDFFGIGFVNALTDSAKRAYNASANIANAAESGLKGAFDRVSRIINGEVEINPTVTPVIDLTNVRSGVNAINGMFGLQPSMGVLANVGAVSSMMNQRGQNGGADEIVSAIGKLEKALGNVGGTTNIINGLNYTDTDGQFNEALGIIVRALLMGGRV